MIEDQLELEEPRRLTIVGRGQGDETRVLAEAAVSALLSALGRGTTSEHLRETPRRVVDSFLELLTPQEFRATTFPNLERYRDLVLEYYSRDLQVQERLTRQVADWFAREVQPRGVGVVIEAEHMCMSLRGVQCAGTTTVTSTFSGELAQVGPYRSQFGLDG